MTEVRVSIMELDVFKLTPVTQSIDGVIIEVTDSELAEYINAGQVWRRTQDMIQARYIRKLDEKSIISGKL